MPQSAALFGGPQQAQTKHLLQFRAGKMVMDKDNWVHADPRKGWVYVYQTSDGKLNLCWIDKKTGLVEDNIVIGAKQAEFKKVPQCTSGRVYLLKPKNLKPLFFWMQESDGKNDSNICSKINDFIKSPPVQFTTPASDWLSSFGGFNQLSQSDLLALLSMGVGLGSGLSSESDVSSAQATAVTIGRHLNAGHADGQANSTSVLGSVTPNIVSSGGPSSLLNAPKRGEKGKIQLQDLRNILSSISGSPKSSEPPIDLNDAISVSSLQDLLEKPEVQARLMPHLPVVNPEANSSKDSSELVTSIRSSQFKTTLKSFSAAFQTGELAPVLSQFKLGPKADEAARRGDLSAFAHALQTGTSQPSNADSSTIAPGSAPAPSEVEQPSKDKEDTPPDAKKDDSGETAMDTD